jgi:hypothetical protein
VALAWTHATEPLFQNVAEVVEQPTAGDGTYVGCNKNDDGLQEVFGFETIASVAEATQVVLWMYAKVGNAAVQPSVRIKLGASWEGAQACSLGTDYGWVSHTFGSLSASQSDIDGLQVGLTAPNPMADGETVFVDTLYAVVTYTEAVASSIKTINGIAKASVKTVNGVAIASMKTWNGIA